jgi:signal transduction histidine kinase
MATRDGRWQRILLSGGLLEPVGGRRTIRDWVVDVTIFGIAVAAGIFVLASTWERHSALVLVLDIVLGSGACLALWLRRERPLAVTLLAVALSSVSALAAMATLPAIFNAAIRLPLRRLAGVTALAVAGTAIFPVLYPDVDGRGYGWQVAVGVLLTAVAVGWGLVVRAQRDLVLVWGAGWEDPARAAAPRRIAREMHDVLAHRLSILSVHAGALENAGSALPSEYVETAGVIRASARAALEELRQVIGLLREHEGSLAPEPPQPTLGQIGALVEESRSAGLSVRYREDVRGSVPAAVGRTAYRAVQEGLTNARKHGRGGPVEVTVDAAGGSPLVVELITRTPASGGVAGTGLMLPGTGTGLVGLAERVDLAGGELRHGPDAHGDFVLRATLPWPA